MNFKNVIKKYLTSDFLNNKYVISIGVILGFLLILKLFGMFTIFSLISALIGAYIGYKIAGKK